MWTPRQRTLRFMLFRLMESVVRYSQINNLTMEVRFRALYLEYSCYSLVLWVMIVPWQLGPGYNEVGKNFLLFTGHNRKIYVTLVRMQMYRAIAVHLVRENFWEKKYEQSSYTAHCWNCVQNYSCSGTPETGVGLLGNIPSASWNMSSHAVWCLG